MRIGQLISGRYRLAEQIGSGGGGTVWRAVDEELGRDVAIKHAVSRDSERGAERIRRLRTEGKILAKVNHPNVVTLHDVVDEGGEWLLVMEYLPAPDLAHHRVLPPARVARLGAQLAAGLAAVHATGILHRDIKPGNVLVTADDIAKLGDFGISRAVHADVTLTETGLLSGTPGFVAPEVANGADPTAASDVFSLGATLFAAIEGVTPFGESGNPFVLLRQAAAGKVAAPTQAGPLTPVLAQLLRVNPAKRPSAAEARTMLENLATDVPVEKRRRGRVVAVSAAVVGVLAAGAVVATGFPSTSADLPAADRAGAPTTVSPIGEPRTADPCALLDPVALARFGETDLNAEYGNFNRCDVIVDSGDGEVDVEVLLSAADGPPEGRIEKIGALDIVREPQESDECARILPMPDQRTRIVITADQLGEGRSDLCGMAEAAATTAAGVLGRGEVPRRPAPNPASLINVDACGLLDGDALARFPGVDAIRPEPGFGGWSCRWNSTTGPATLRLIFDRHQPPTAEDGRPVRFGGHQAFVEPEGYGEESCQVGIVHREYRGEDGRLVERLLVVVMGPQPTEELCRLATALAEPAAASLPA
ncbi:protein kinase domain-containing protein [Saccharopolyspora sp. NPDC003752]